MVPGGSRPYASLGTMRHLFARISILCALVLLPACPDLDIADTEGDSLDSFATLDTEPPIETTADAPDPCVWADVVTFGACHTTLFPHSAQYPAECFEAATAQRDTCPDAVDIMPGEDGAPTCSLMDSEWGLWTWCDNEQWVCKVDGLEPDKGPVCADSCGQTWLADSEPKPDPC